ncbi:hypothetical protein D3C72_1843620 [compost metagenome]
MFGTQRGIHHAQLAFGIDKQPAVVAGVANPDDVLFFVFAQGYQPEDRFGTVEPSHGFAVDLVPVGTDLGQEKPAQGRVVESAQVLSVHGASRLFGTFVVFRVPLMPVVAAEIVMYVSGLGVDLAIERLLRRVRVHPRFMP